MEEKPKKKGMSEFFRKVAHASWQTGWSTPKDHCSLFSKQFVVSEGEYAGTWEFRRGDGRLNYYYRSDLLVEDEALTCLPYPLLNWKKGLLSEFNRHAYMIQKLDWTAKPGKIEIQKKSERRDYTYTWTEKGEYGHPYVYAMHLDTTFGKNAIILAARAGHGSVWLRQELTKVPGRVDSLKVAIHVCQKLRSHKDRVSFSKKFLDTWSVNKSLPAWVKRPERWKKLFAKGLYTGGMFASLEWIKLVPTRWTGVRHASAEGGLDILCQLSVKVQKGEFNLILGQNPKIGEKREVFKKLVNPRSSSPAWDIADQAFGAYGNYVTDIRDGMNEWRELAARPQDWPLVDPDNEWIPRAQDAVEKQKLYIFHELHGQISRATRTLRQLDWEQYRGTETLAMKAQLEKAQLHHENVPVTVDNLKFPCSCETEFRVMSTYPEFLDEGREMHHCIASYFTNHREMYLLAIKGKDGERSSAEVSFPKVSFPKGFFPEDLIESEIYQMRGFANKLPSIELRDALGYHLNNCLKVVPTPEEDEEQKKGIIQKLIGLVLNR